MSLEAIADFDTRIYNFFNQPERDEDRIYTLPERVINETVGAIQQEEQVDSTRLADPKLLDSIQWLEDDHQFLHSSDVTNYIGDHLGYKDVFQVDKSYFEDIDATKSIQSKHFT